MIWQNGQTANRFSIFFDEQGEQWEQVAENSGKWPTTLKFSSSDFFEGRLIGAAFFLVWKFFNHWVGKTKAKAYGWHTNCRIHFIIIISEFTALIWRKLKKKKICFFCQLDKKLSCDQRNRFLPYTGYIHRRLLSMKSSLYLLIPLLIFQYFSQLLDHGSCITRWRIFCPSILWQTRFDMLANHAHHVSYACSVSKMSCAYNLLLPHLSHRCYFLIILPWAWKLSKKSSQYT